MNWIYYKMNFFQLLPSRYTRDNSHTWIFPQNLAYFLKQNRANLQSVAVIPHTLSNT